MAIIYSYPETTQILLTDMLIGTSTIKIAGKKKNLTKNFTIETLGLFIQDNFPTATPSLNQVLTVGNTSLLNAKIGQLYLYDTSEIEYGHIALADSGYDLYSVLGGLIARIEGTGIVLQGPTYNSQILTGTTTANRLYTLPNASGTIALTSDIPPAVTPNLNDVLTNGNTSLLDAKVGKLGLWDTINSYYNKLLTQGNTFAYQLNSGANIFAVSPSSVSLSNGTATLEIINGITATRTLYWPDATGTIALTTDIVPLTFTSPLVDTLGTITIDQSNTTTDGYLSFTDWNTFNGKQDTITLTTTGSSGAATFIANTLNIPNYSTDLSGFVPYTGATGSVNLGIYNLTANSIIKQGGTSTEFLMANGTVTIGNGGVYSYEIHVSQVDGNDITGTGALLNPVATITKALTLITGLRRTIVIHPGNYTENPNVTFQYTVLTTYAQVGGNTLITGTISTNTGCTISGLKMTNLNITTPTGTGNVNILNCDVSGTLTKSSTGDYTLIRFTDIGATNITSSAGLIAIFGGNPNFITINNAGARVIVKNAVTVAPVLISGNANFVDCIIIATTGTSNAITTSAGTIVTLANSQIVVPTFNNVARVSLSGFYSIFNTVFDKPNSFLISLSGTGGTTNSIDYFQFINADKFIKQGGTSLEYLMADGSVSTLTNPITGTGTTNYVSKFTGTNTLGDSLIYDNGTNVGIGTASPTVPFDLIGNQLITFADVANRDNGPFAFNVTNGTFSRFNLVHDASASRVNIFGTSTQGLRFDCGSSNSITAIGGSGLTINATGNNLTINGQTTILNAGGSERIRINNSGNTLINTTTDNGGKLQIKAPGALSTDIALKVRDSTNTVDLMTLDGLGRVNIKSNTFTGTMSLAQTGNFTSVISGGPASENITFGPSNRIFLNASQVNVSYLNVVSNISASGLSGVAGTALNIIANGSFVASGALIQNHLKLTSTVAQQNTSPIFNALYIEPTINNTTTTTAIARGIYYNPILTSLTGTTHRAIETVTGNVIFGSTSGNVGIGTTTPIVNFQVTTNSTAIPRGVILEQTSADTNAFLLTMRKSRAGAAAVNADNIGNWYADAFDGTQYTSGARIRFSIDGVVSSGVVPTSFQIFTGTGSSGGTERFRITSSGNTLINTTTDNGGKLQIKAGGALSTDIALRVRNSADTLDIVTIQGDGSLKIGQTSSSVGSLIVTGQLGNAGATSANFNSTNNNMSFNCGYYFQFRCTNDSNKILFGTAYDSPSATTFGYNERRYVVGASTIDTSAVLQADSTTKGFLPPRMTTTQRDAIATPATGLSVYNTTLGTQDFYNGTSWNRFGTQTLIKAPGALSTDIALRVRNSADTADIMTVNGDSTVTGYNGTQLNFRLGAGTVGQGISTRNGQFSFGAIDSSQNAGVRILVVPSSGNSYIDGYSDGTTKGTNYPIFIGSRVNNTVSSITNSTTQENGTQVVFGYAVNEASSLVTINSTTRGFLPPRMTNAQRIAIATPAIGLMVYCTDTTEGLYINKSTGWTFII